MSPAGQPYSTFELTTFVPSNGNTIGIVEHSVGTHGSSSTDATDATVLPLWLTPMFSAVRQMDFDVVCMSLLYVYQLLT